jgi:hypothetical protein
VKTIDLASQNLRDMFIRSLLLPAAAVDWLLMLWGAIQVFDDVADGDDVKRYDLDAAIWNTLVTMPQNAFYREHGAVLSGALATMILKWQASDQAERDGCADARSYMWRAGFYDVVLLTVQLCNGADFAHQRARQVMQMYGEKMEDYLKEFENA